VEGIAGHTDIGCSDCHVVSAGDMTVEASRGGIWSAKHTRDAVPTFKVYSSPSFDALGTDIGQPDGASRLCLGCHDGSYSGLRGRMSAFGFNDLARSHPVSFTYNSALVLRAPRGTLNDPRSAPSRLGGSIAADLLDERGKMQCTSCHNIHSKRKGNSLLRYDYSPGSRSGSEMCRVCHNR